MNTDKPAKADDSAAQEAAESPPKPRIVTTCIPLRFEEKPEKQSETPVDE